MSDLLGSILKSMQVPKRAGPPKAPAATQQARPGPGGGNGGGGPGTSSSRTPTTAATTAAEGSQLSANISPTEKARLAHVEAMKRAREAQEKEKQRLKDFRANIQKRLDDFTGRDDCRVRRLSFEPMDQIMRSIIHDLVDDTGLINHSVGMEGYDRRVVVWKPDYPPSDLELDALRRGETAEWDEAKERSLLEAKEREEMTALREEIERQKREREAKRSGKGQPEAKYKEKYDKLVGSAVGLEAAQDLKMHEMYGMVPSELKQDKRSIEEVLNARKKARGAGNSTAGGSSDQTSQAAAGDAVEHSASESMPGPAATSLTTVDSPDEN